VFKEEFKVEKERHVLDLKESLVIAIELKWVWWEFKANLPIEKLLFFL